MGNKKSETVQWSGIPQNDTEEKRVLAESILVASEAFRELEEAKAHIKEIYDDVKEKTGCPKRIWSFLVKSAYFANGMDSIQKSEEVKEAHEVLIESGYIDNLKAL